MDELSVRVTHRGREHVVRVPADATVADLGIELERATGASVATQKVLGLKLAKLILKGGTLTPSKAEDAVLAVSAIPGMCDSAKPYMLMGSAAAEVAAVLANRTRARSGVLVGVPIPVADELDPVELDRVLGEALADCDAAGITGAAITPFVLGRIGDATGGRSVPANLALAENNARVAADIAVAIAR